MSDDLVRLREAFGAGAIVPSDGCPPAARLFAAANGELEPEEVGELVDHVADCAACALSWRLAVELEPRDEDAEVIPLFPDGPPGPRRPRPGDLPGPRLAATPVPPPRRASPVRRALGATAATVLAVAALVTLAVLPTYLRPTRTFGPAPTEVDPRPFLTGAPPADPPGWTVSTPQPERAVPGTEPVVLAWSGAPAGSRYDVVVTDDQLYPIARVAALAEPTWTVPASVVSEHRPGSRLLWRVEAVSPSGQRVSSPTWALVLTR